MECMCGSGKQQFALYDARGIYCCAVCDDCEDDKRAKYRADVFTDSQYDCDEYIDSDY